MTAADLLRSSLPPTDDGVIEKAIAELDLKIWEWTDALKSAQAQLRSAFAVRPAGKPSAALYEGISPTLSQAAAAAHIPSPPTPPQWAALGPSNEAAQETRWNPPSPASSESQPAFAAEPSTFAPTPSAPAFQPAPAAFAPAPSAPPAQEWGQTSHSSPFGGHGMQANEAAPAGAMQWPTAPGGSWPETPAMPASGAQAWPTWTPTDAAAPPVKKSGVRAQRAPKSIRQTLPEGPSPEERAQKAAAEEALLSGLEDAIARRVRLLRRLDPDTPIEKLIDKARQGHAEAQVASANAPKDDKSSWWRRK